MKVPIITQLRSILSRESSSGRFIPEIDGLRFIAIISVLFYHMNGYLLKKTGRPWDPDAFSRLADKGNFGVQLFFVISGFIIAYPFMRGSLGAGKVPKLKPYFVRRICRLEPPYIINLLVITVLILIAGKMTITEALPHLLASLSYTHNVVFGEHSLINGVAWSLEIELQFYVLAPFLLWGVMRIKNAAARRIALAVLILGASAYSSYGVAGNPRIGLSILNFAGYFLAGFLLCDIYIVSWNEKPENHIAWDIFGIPLWISMPLLLETPGAVLLPLVVFGAYACMFRGKLIRVFCRMPIVYTIGGMCYSIYLWHFYFISALGRFALRFLPFGSYPFWLELIAFFIVVGIPTLIFCTVIFMLTERPFMVRDWPQKFYQWMSPRRSPGARRESKRRGKKSLSTD